MSTEAILPMQQLPRHWATILYQLFNELRESA